MHLSHTDEFINIYSAHKPTVYFNYLIDRGNSVKLEVQTKKFVYINVIFWFYIDCTGNVLQLVVFGLIRQIILNLFGEGVTVVQVYHIQNEHYSFLNSLHIVCPQLRLFLVSVHSANLSKAVSSFRGVFQKLPAKFTLYFVNFSFRKIRNGD